jgi:hypothetical protein
MPYQRGHQKRPPPSTSAATDAEAFRLVGIQSTRPPEGCIGHDWLVYQIAQGKNVITGYRRGDLSSATAEVERIVIGLNERRVAGKNRPGPKPKPPAGAPAPPTPSPPDGQAS